MSERVVLYTKVCLQVQNGSLKIGVLLLEVESHFDITVSVFLFEGKYV